MKEEDERHPHCCITSFTERDRQKLPESIAQPRAQQAVEGAVAHGAPSARARQGGMFASASGSLSAIAAAILDRLLHRSTVLSIKGNSYRLRERAMAAVRTPEPQPVQA